MFIFHENYYSVADLLKESAAQIVFFQKQEASHNGKDEQMFGYIKYF